MEKSLQGTGKKLAFYYREIFLGCRKKSYSQSINQSINQASMWKSCNCWLWFVCCTKANPSQMSVLAEWSLWIRKIRKTTLPWWTGVRRGPWMPTVLRRLGRKSPNLIPCPCHPAPAPLPVRCVCIVWWVSFVSIAFLAESSCQNLSDGPANSHWHYIQPSPELRSDTERRRSPSPDRRSAGRILSVELKNFMVYRNKTIVPGQYVNFVTGRNGSKHLNESVL